MYKLLLCWRYLRTRWIALASIVSVTLGVATMIVVNSVMEGFRHEMQERIHGILSDVVFESRNLTGFYDPEAHMQQIRMVVGDQIEGMTPTVVVPGIISYTYNDRSITSPVQIIGIEAETQGRVGDFGKYLQHPLNRQELSFDLRPSGYDTQDHQSTLEARDRPQMAEAGSIHRQRWLEQQRFYEMMRRASEPKTEATDAPTEEDPFQRGASATETPETQSDAVYPGAVLAIGLASYRGTDGSDHFVVLPGSDVRLSFPTAGTPPDVTHSSFTVVDIYESKMSEYDSSFVFVPIHELQRLRGMFDPTTGIGFASSIQIKLKPGVDGDAVRDRLRAMFPPQLYNISTWRDKQGPLLAAVQMETAILNVLLFLIIAVAGFGILAIFFMIVVEKTRDIGILKSLGASRRGILGIFLGYGLSLGMVGAGAGMLIGLAFVAYINQIADVLGWITGHEVFDPAIYYFQKIPTIIEPFTVSWIVLGALAIAVMASVLPARRAARLHPVEALRYE